MKEYLVKWEIHIDAETAREAAEEARAIQLDPDSIESVFEVYDPVEVHTEVIDLGLDHEPSLGHELPGYLTQAITSPDNAKDFLRALDAADKLYHLEGNPREVIYCGSGFRLFTDEECKYLDRRVEEVFAQLKDPFEFIMDELVNGIPDNGVGPSRQQNGSNPTKE